MKVALKCLVVLVLMSVATRASAQVSRIAGIASGMDESLGYTYMQSNVPSQGQLPMMGTVFSATKGLNTHFGVKLQVGYSRSFDAFQTGRSADILTYMGGPVFYPVRHRRFDIHAHVLFGGARETGVNFKNDGTLVRGFVNYPAWAGGLGFQCRITRSLSLRPEVEYLKTSFFDANATVHNQYNIRMSLSLTFNFGQRE